MLYGNVIFIKKLGGDGSKFPVTIGSVKIGRSDDCLIRIQNPLVSSEHCEILIDECGQGVQVVTDNIDDRGGNNNNDISNGERLARWEYLPSSKYYNKSESNLNCPVADVMPQERMFEGSSARNSESFKCSLKRSLNSSVPAGGPGLNSKLSRLSLNPASSVEKNLKRRSLQLRKIPFSPQVDAKGNMKLQSLQNYESQSERKTSLRQTQAWEIQSVSPSNNITAKIKSSKKPTSVKVLDNQFSNDKLIKPCIAGTSDLEAIKYFTPRKEEISSKKFSGFEASNDFLKCFSVESTKSFSKMVKTPSSGTIKTCEKYSQKSNRKENLSKEDNAEISVSMFDIKNNSSVESHRGSNKFTPSRKSKTRKSLLKKSVSRFRSADLITSTSVVEVKGSSKPNSSPVQDEIVDDVIKLSRSKSLNSLEFSKQEYPILSSQDLNPNSFAATVKSNLKPKTLLCSASEIVNILPLENKLSSNVENCFPKENYNLKKISDTEDASTGKNDAESRTKKTSRNRASKRKFTSFVASAERAAKKLKIISLTKPDKNKKAALLVLGKAGSKMKMLQNTNTIIKNKIVKKAIKQKRNGRKNSGPLESVQSISTSKKKILKNRGIQDSNAEPYSFDGKQLQEESNSQLLMKIENPKKNLNKSSLKSLDERSFSKQVKKRAGRSIIKDCDYETNSEIEIKGNDTQHDVLLSSTPSHSFVSDEVSNLKESKKSENVDVGKEIKTNNNSCQTQYDSSEMFNRGISNKSKRSSSKGFSAFSNFIEASPIALRLSPRNTVNVFKTPKQINHSSSLITAKNKRSSGLIKSASTSKINRKGTKLRRKTLNESSISDLNLTRGTTFNFSDIQTPDISTEMFVSPLSERNSVKEKLKTPLFNSKRLKNDKRSLKELNRFPEEEIINKSRRKSRSLRNSQRELYVTMEQWKEEENLKSADTENQQVKISQKSTKKNPKNHSSNVNGIQPLMELPEPIKPNNIMLDVKGMHQLMELPLKSPKNDLTDVRGVRRLMESPKLIKSPKNDLTDVRGVRRLMKSLRPRKSPKNDLTDVRGVRRLMESPKPVKSPKNDLTDVRGVRRLMKSLRPRKSPKNDLTDVRGVRRLMESPRRQKSPKNDLTDVRGVRRLMKSLRPRKSPKNDLTDVRGVRRLMESPRRQKSPKNDLTDVRGVRRLMESPKPVKSPKNDLTDVRGVRRLMESPRRQKSPKNDLTDVRGVRRLMESPKTIKSPKNDLTDVRGVRRLMESPKPVKSPKNDLTGVDGIKHLMEISEVQKSPQNDLSNVSGLELLFESSFDKIQSIKSGHSNLHKKDEVHQLFSLNKEENFDFDTSGTGELFISPNKPRSCRKRLGCVDNIPYFMQVRVTRSSRGIISEDTKEIKSPRKIPRRIPKTTKEIEDTKIVEKTPLNVIQPENTIIEMQNKRITRSNKTNKLKISLTPVEKEISKNVFESDFKNKEKEKQEVEDTDSINVEDCKSSSGKRIYKRAETLSKTNTEKSRRRLLKRNSAAQNSPVARKMTRNAKRLIDEKQNEANSGIVHTSKTKKAVSKNATSTKSETTSIRLRRKCISEESNKLNTRSKTKSEITESSRTKSKTRNCNQSITSPVKTRQQRWKEKSSIMELRTSPLKTRKKEK